MAIIDLLKQYRSICREIEEKRIAVKDNTEFDTVRGSDSEYPYTQHTISVSGVTPSKDNMRMMARLKQLEQQKETVDSFIDSIEDSEIRRIFEFKYIRGTVKPSWTKVAMMMGGGNTKDGVRMECKRFLEKM